MNTVSVKKASNIQAVEIQITLQDGHHHLVNYIMKFMKIYKLLRARINEGSDKRCIRKDKTNEMRYSTHLLKYGVY